MTVSTEVSREEYTGNGVTTDFDYRFRVFSAADLVVSVADTTETITVLTLNTDYTVTGAGSRTGGKVKLLSPLAFNWRISIERALPVTQETDIRNQGNFFPEVHEDAFDKLTMLIQQVWGYFGLALRKPTWLSKYYDALGNRIANLGNPINQQDAATKSYVDSAVAGSDGHADDLFKRALRFPDNVDQMPPVSVRGHSLQGYTEQGKPVPVFSMTDTADLALKLASDSGATLVGTHNGLTVQDAINKTYAKNVYQVENFPGISDSETVDSADALQALIDSNPDGVFVLPENIALTKPIKYYGYTTIRGQRGRKAAVNLIAGFPANRSAFEPYSTAKYAVQFAALESILIVDRTASADTIILANGTAVTGRGTTGTARGIDITGTFSAEIRDIVGVRLETLIYSTIGAVNENQTTARPFISEIDVSNCNYIIRTEPATGNWFPYGDFYLADIKTSGACKYGVSIEDLDGLHTMGFVAFASCNIRFSGNFAKFVGVHPFDPKAQISENAANSKITAESFHISRRAGGAPSEDIQLTNITSVNAGRLADTTIGSPAPNNIGAYGILCENVQGLDISGEIKDPSMGAVRFVDCSLVTFNLKIRRTNSQVLGSGALPPGTYNSIQIEGCTSVEGRYVDLSPSRNYSAYVDDSSVGIKISGTVGAGSIANRFYRLPDNNVNKIDLIAEHASGYKPVTSGDYETNHYAATHNNATPSGTMGRNNVILEFSNDSSTSVTDIISVMDRQRVIVSIRDNGATKLINTDNGGKFKGIDNNTQGRGQVLMFYRDPDNGYLVKI